VRVPEELWREDRISSIKIGAFPAGVIDGLSNEIKGLSDFTVMIYDCVFRKGYFGELMESLSDINLVELVETFRKEKQEQYLTTRVDELNHQVGEDLVASVSLAVGLKALYSSAKKLTLHAAKKLSDLSSDLAKDITKYSKLGYEVVEEEGRYFAKKGKDIVELGEDVGKWNGLNLGKFVKKIGDYEVYEGGEIFYRTMHKEDYEVLLSTKKLSSTGETFTSPTQLYSEKYKGYLVKISAKHGTIDNLRSIGVTDGTIEVLERFGQMPVSSSRWTSSKALFKYERGQVNIGLGKGNALNIFNDNINGIELIKIIE
jgi:hypothetical protein